MHQALKNCISINKIYTMSSILTFPCMYMMCAHHSGHRLIVMTYLLPTLIGPLLLPSILHNALMFPYICHDML